jgi:FtsP/CotA-like multicopper oxidase with cupredoxin domain
VHLHGHHVSLLYEGAETPYQVTAYKAAVDVFNTQENGKDSAGRKTLRAAVNQQAPTYPMQRNTIMAEKYQFLIVAFHADNPGVWALR